MNIVICGSMSASKEMVTARDHLVALGHEVTLPQSTETYADMAVITRIVTESAREKTESDLIRGYFNKIKACDAIVVVNVVKHGVEGYIGGNTFLEMGFAFVLEKKIYVLHDIPSLSYRDEIQAMRPVVLHGDYAKIQ